MAQRNPWGGEIGKPAVLSVARKVAARDGLSWPLALRRALAWAKAKAAPVDRYKAYRAAGMISPRDHSEQAQAMRKPRRGGALSQWAGR